MTGDKRTVATDTIAYHEVLASSLFFAAVPYPRLQHEGQAMRVPEFRERYRAVGIGTTAEDEVVLRGRIHSIRQASSKLFFFQFTSEFESVQALCNLGKLEEQGVTLADFKKCSKILQRGDIISIRGRATKTSTGELTIEATRLPQLLSPSLVPLPVKLGDDDTRMQSRHIDMLVNPSTADTLRLRSHIIKFLRDFLHQKGFLEVQTPILAEDAGGAIARPFSTRAHEFADRNLALRIAPELWLKRLVVGGMDRVFEIGQAFRNEGIDQTHNPEFTTCEFYSAYANLEDLISLTGELLEGTAKACMDLISEKLVSLPNIHVESYSRPYRRIEFIPSLEKALACRLPDLSSKTALDDVRSIVQARNLDIPEPSTRTLPKLLDRLAGTFIEPCSAEAPIFITHHPVCMSPLSKSFTCPGTGQLVSARAELFMGGKELANMYEEENDPGTQRRKFVEQARYRDHQAVDPDDVVVVDESYIRALESGLPPTGGWGCGIERLVMSFAGTRRISDCLSFGNLRNVVGLSAENRTSHTGSAAADMEKHAP
ncbi:hypothetical protein P8C59_008147 [Phyllachora maydis]|uniref:Lysyl-tRNA synthetase n=1 Tax=Phyllachora maydis TaxID=1825666 RepID=A0AAD9MEX4_9PEZI|nr:hypothetical protein P8C59_008147 [Phyllachora maydis]